MHSTTSQASTVQKHSRTFHKPLQSAAHSQPCYKQLEKHFPRTNTLRLFWPQPYQIRYPITCIHMHEALYGAPAPQDISWRRVLKYCLQIIRNNAINYPTKRGSLHPTLYTSSTHHSAIDPKRTDARPSLSGAQFIQPRRRMHAVLRSRTMRRRSLNEAGRACMWRPRPRPAKACRGQRNAASCFRSLQRRRRMRCGPQ